MLTSILFHVLERCLQRHQDNFKHQWCFRNVYKSFKHWCFTFWWTTFKFWKKRSLHLARKEWFDIQANYQLTGSEIDFVEKFIIRCVYHKWDCDKQNIIIEIQTKHCHSCTLVCQVCALLCLKRWFLHHDIYFNERRCAIYTERTWWTMKDNNEKRGSCRIQLRSLEWRFWHRLIDWNRSRFQEQVNRCHDQNTSEWRWHARYFYLSNFSHL